jgi:hypothetical protein
VDKGKYMITKFKKITRHGSETWQHLTAPVWIVRYEGIEGSNTHRYDKYQAYRAVEKMPNGRDPWTVDNRRIGPENGYSTLDKAFIAANGFAV